MPLPPPVRVGTDFPFVPGSAFGVEDYLEDFLVQGLEQLLVQLAPGTADGGRRHRSRLWQFDPHRPALPPQFGKRSRISRTPLREHQPENEQHDHQRVQHAPTSLPDPVMPVGDIHEVLDSGIPQVCTRDNLTSRLPVLTIRVYNSGVEGVLGSGGFDAEEIHGGVSSG